MRPQWLHHRLAPFTRWLAVGTALALVVSAYATSSSSGNTTKSPAAHNTSAAVTKSTATAAAAKGLSAKDIRVVHSYVGGTIGAKATKSPIKIGMVVSNVGATGQPYLASDYRNAVTIINDDLGGISGHPIQLVQCDFGGTAQQGQICGSQFANNKSIKAVLFGGGTTGGAQLHAANNGVKPYLCTVASPTDTTAKNTFCTQAGALASGAILTYMKKYLHAKTVAIDSITDPGLDAVVNLQKPLYAKDGIKATTGFAPAGSTDVTSTLVASGATTADAVLLELPVAATCAPFIKSLKTLGVTKPVVSLQTCSDPTVAAQVGGIPHYTFLEYGRNTALPDPSGESQVFNDANKMLQNGAGQNAAQTFGTGLLLGKILNEVGYAKLTPAAISAKLKAFTGPMFLGDPVLKFGVQPYPAVGTTRARFFTYTSSGWKDATGGNWLSAP
jgi:branched-chain amino acid transport system substrate-binding protein